MSVHYVNLARSQRSRAGCARPPPKGAPSKEAADAAMPPPTRGPAVTVLGLRPPAASSAPCAPRPRGSPPPPARPVRPLQGAPRDPPRRLISPRRPGSPIVPSAAENNARNGLLSAFRYPSKGRARPDPPLGRCPRRAARRERLKEEARPCSPTPIGQVGATIEEKP